MQIVVTCDSYEELIAAAKQILKDHTDAPASKPAKVTKKAEPAPDPEPMPWKDSPAEEPTDKAETAKNSVKLMSAAEVETSVKVLLADKIKGGKKAEVRALFGEYGVTKLSELMAKCPDKLAEFSEKAEAL